jgi:hypothetical protein
VEAGAETGGEAMTEANKDAKLWATLAHASGLVFCIRIFK